jgi:uncharacterized protein (TIGR03000 family)
MYSVVLMAALTAGTSTPSWGWGCHGCHGGFGGCHGCHGFLSSWHGCHGGCHGGYGCSGSSCHGCYGSSYGCYGGGCHGSYGYGCYGSAYSGCSGSGCTGCHGMATYAPAHVSPPAAPPGGQMPEPVPAPKKEEKKTSSLDQARLIVELPADAKLYVDDRLMQTTSERRVFNSPRLEQGQTYYYVLRAEVVRDGNTQSETKRVLVHAGEVVQASFLDLGGVATVRAEETTARAEANARR